MGLGALTSTSHAERGLKDRGPGVDAERSTGSGYTEAYLRGGIRKRTLHVAFTMLIQAATLFVSSGRPDWIAAWAYIALSLGEVSLNSLVILPRNPELIAERGRAREGTRTWDRVLPGITSFFGPLATRWPLAGRTAWCGIRGT